ncbi:glutamyl-tRNA synthetase [Uncinocarpus reesii 1704]|uniref:Glutamyl-tRNA synthetase n=1 Tax=Uncinocarpus reesii (strain UAMH 1704) TaxID=336963 RepID=C4JUL2_UNCRE|nr:glutamyl-tRNA synthetase [Uncinocarpus reesii 1704]EEP79973.1 glutamyl-tRNA synthetase [Uncinocarpus reesii 1704]
MRPSTLRLFAQKHWICKSCRANFSTTPTRAAKKSKPSLPDSPARTRFAPSPTGYLHLGSLRTALFNYLLAKRTGGQFLLRIEDTDQSERTELYKLQVGSLISTGHAYRCFCSPERLDTLARHRHDLGLPPGYDGACVSISKEESEERASKGAPHVVRLRVAEPYPMFDDMVYGKTGQNRAAKHSEVADTYADPILLKTDGHPTYHLANVVDDHFMKITHVIRGTEWMSSTPMHVALYNAFQWKPPQFGHVPLLVEKSGQKLSKRNADIDIAYFRDQQAIMPETLVNFAALLGWSHLQKSDVFSLRELEETFDLKLTKGNTIVAFEKMWFLQKAHAQRYAASGGPMFDELVRLISSAARQELNPEEYSPILKSRSLEDFVSSILREGPRSYTTPVEFIHANKSFFTQTVHREPYVPASATSLDEPSKVPMSALHTAAAALSMVPVSHWNAETHRYNITSYIYTDPSLSADLESKQAQKSAQQLFRKELYHYLRWALSGGAPGLGIPSTMEILGREESVRRLDGAREATKSWASVGKGQRRRVTVQEESGERSNAWMGSLAGASKE